MEVMSWAQFLSTTLALVMPLIVRYITAATWAGKYRSYILMLLSAANGLLVEILDPLRAEGFDLRSALFRAVLAFITSVAVYQGVWKQQTGLMDKLDNSGVKTKATSTETFGPEKRE